MNNANRGSHTINGYNINTKYFSGNKPMSVSSYFEIFAIRSHSFYRKKNLRLSERASLVARSMHHCAQFI